MAYQKYVTLSYDDGPKFDRRFVEMLNFYGIRCTFNLISGSMPEDDPDSWYISRSEAASLYKGHEIAAHSRTHPHLENLPEEAIRQEILINREELERIAGYPVRGCAYPYGTWNDTVVKVLRECGIRYSRTTRSTKAFLPPEKPLLLDPTCHHRDPDVFRLIDEFLAAEPSDGDLLFYLWGHSFEFDRGEEHNSWEHIEAVLRALSGKPGVRYVTNMDFFDRGSVSGLPD